MFVSQKARILVRVSGHDRARRLGVQIVPVVSGLF